MAPYRISIMNEDIGKYDSKQQRKKETKNIHQEMFTKTISRLGLGDYTRRFEAYLRMMEH